MSFVAMTKPAQGTATKKSQIDQLIDNDNDLIENIVGATPGIMNGSFESGTSPNAPTGWEKGATWGTQDFETSAVSHGAKAWKMSSTGSGGGELQMEGFDLVSPAVPYILSFLHRSSAAGIHNLVEVLWYTAAQSYISATTIYDDDATNPASFLRFIRWATPPATARYAKIKITGASSDNATAGTAYWDDFRVMDVVETPIPVWMAEVTEHEDAYSDTGIFRIRIPSGVTTLKLASQLKNSTDAGGIAKARWRIGARFSDEQTVTGTTYDNVVNTMDVTDLSGTSVDLFFQLGGSGNHGCGIVPPGASWGY